MPYSKIDTTTTRAPRNLTRATAQPRVYQTMAGPVEGERHGPSVGGVAEVSHDIHRCTNCRALAVTAAGRPVMGKCGKCHL